MDLGQATRELIARQTSLDEFTYRFLAARTQTCLRPALLATHGSRWVGDWPGLVHDPALVQLMGNHDWFARTGEDLASQLPAAVSSPGRCRDAAPPRGAILEAHVFQSHQ